MLLDKVRYASDCDGDVRPSPKGRGEPQPGGHEPTNGSGPVGSQARFKTVAHHIPRVASGGWSRLEADPKGSAGARRNGRFPDTVGRFADPVGRSFFGGFISWRKMPGVRGRRVCECPHGFASASSPTALADDAATGHAASDEHGLGLASGAGRNHPISLAKSAGRPASKRWSEPVTRRRTDTFRCSTRIRRQLGGTANRLDPNTHTRCRVALHRVDSADLETSTRPRAPGKTGSPVEITSASADRCSLTR
jgi:hypothetical protein